MKNIVNGSTALPCPSRIKSKMSLCEQILLGEPARGTFYKWRKGEGPVIAKDTLERISYVMGIYKALRVLFPSEAQANDWPHRANRDFSNNTAMSFMLQGSVTHLSDMRRYLDAMRG
jgi:hypothetical protein